MSLNKNFNKLSWRKAVDELIDILIDGQKNYYIAIYVAKNNDMYRKPNMVYGNK